MASSSLCNTLRNTLLNHQNELQVVRSQLFQVRQEKQRLDQLISNIKNQIENARLSAQVGRNAGRIFGPLGGGAVAVLSGTETAIRIARLESEKNNAESKIGQVTLEVSRLDEALRGHEFGIPQTLREMEREGCGLN